MLKMEKKIMNKTYKVQFPDYFFSLNTYETNLAKAKMFARTYLNVSRLPAGVTFYK